MSIDAKDFEAKCMTLIDEVAKTGKSLVITKDGIPVAQLSPLQRRPKAVIGAMQGSIAIKGDIVSPPDAGLGDHRMRLPAGGARPARLDDGATAGERFKPT